MIAEFIGALKQFYIFVSQLRYRHQRYNRARADLVGERRNGRRVLNCVNAVRRRLAGVEPQSPALKCSPWQGVQRRRGRIRAV